MNDLTIEQMRSKAELLTEKAAIHAIQQLMQNSGITKETLLRHLSDTEDGITESQRLQDMRRSTALQNRQRESMARARRAKAENAVREQGYEGEIPNPPTIEDLDISAPGSGSTETSSLTFDIQL